MKPHEDLELVAGLALYQRDRDIALGLEHTTDRQRGLLWYSNKTKKQLEKDYFSAAVKQAKLEAIRAKMKEIMAEAESAPTEEKKRLLKRAIELRKQAKRLAKNG